MYSTWIVVVNTVTAVRTVNVELIEMGQAFGAPTFKMWTRIVLPAAALLGAAFLVLCDLVARTIISPVELPVGIVTAVIGGPFFLWLLVKHT